MLRLHSHMCERKGNTPQASSRNRCPTRSGMDAATCAARMAPTLCPARMMSDSPSACSHPPMHSACSLMTSSGDRAFVSSGGAGTRPHPGMSSTCTLAPEASVSMMNGTQVPDWEECPCTSTKVGLPGTCWELTHRTVHCTPRTVKVRHVTARGVRVVCSMRNSHRNSSRLLKSGMDLSSRNRPAPATKPHPTPLATSAGTSTCPRASKVHRRQYPATAALSSRAYRGSWLCAEGLCSRARLVYRDCGESPAPLVGDFCLFGARTAGGDQPDRPTCLTMKPASKMKCSQAGGQNPSMTEAADNVEAASSACGNWLRATA